MRNPAVEYNVTAFSELFFAARWQGIKQRLSTTSNNTNLMSSCQLQQRWWKILLKRSTSVR